MSHDHVSTGIGNEEQTELHVYENVHINVVTYYLVLFYLNCIIAAAEEYL